MVHRAGSSEAGEPGRKRRLVLALAALLVGLSAVTAVVWWTWLPRGLYVLPWAGADRGLVLPLAFASVQLISLLFAVRLVVSAWRSPRPFLAWAALAVGFLLFCANALNLLSPAWGVPVLAIVGFAAFGGGSAPGKGRSGGDR